MASLKKSAPFRGYVQLYTGDGKGKTTAALGLALRAAGHGLKTYLGQFMKGQSYGELASIQKLAPLITIEQFGRKSFLHITAAPPAAEIRRARRGLRRCRAAMLSGEYAIVVLDEVLVAIFFKLLTEAEVHAVLDEKPEGVEIVLTGRRAAASLVRRADLVTEMKERKHYYRKGVEARAGIER
jgi:cob(I)alamin adenosyltransferase